MLSLSQPSGSLLESNEHINGRSLQGCYSPVSSTTAMPLLGDTYLTLHMHYGKFWSLEMSFSSFARGKFCNNFFRLEPSMDQTSVSLLVSCIAAYALQEILDSYTQIWVKGLSTMILVNVIFGPNSFCSFFYLFFALIFFCATQNLMRIQIHWES